MRELALFAGAGGGILGGRILGWRTRCAVEINPFCRSVLLQRQRDGHLERFPIWDDIRTFDGRPWSDSIDIVTGGFPCQGISTAGSRKGLADTRSALWFEMLRIVGEARPKFVFAENSPNLRTHGLGTVIQGLNSLGYDVRWCVLGAWHLGAPHRRNRLWILASDTDSGMRDGWTEEQERKKKRRTASRRDCWWASEPKLGRVAHGLADRVDRLKAIGNGQVPIVAAAAFKILSDGWTGVES